MTEWHLDPDERRVAHAWALVRDDEAKSSSPGVMGNVAIGAGYVASEPHFEPLSDSQLADAADLPRFDPLEHINPLDA